MALAPPWSYSFGRKFHIRSVVESSLHDGWFWISWFSCCFWHLLFAYVELYILFRDSCVVLTATETLLQTGYFTELVYFEAILSIVFEILGRSWFWTSSLLAACGNLKGAFRCCATILVKLNLVMSMTVILPFKLPLGDDTGQYLHHVRFYCS